MSADYQRARRDAARARGECLQCCRRPVAPGMSRCARCLEVNAKAYARRQGHDGVGKHCAACNEAGHDKRTCPTRVARASGKWCDECIACGFHRADCPTRRVA
jgi:hypothetical protein